uniref:Ig-like domain-containing protein n=1 Tax=Megaselia scalaris TaxID=36166 RepID=T1GS17_MEGSC
MDLVKCILSIILHIFIILNCIISLAKITAVIAQATSDPVFLAPLDNFTVPQGREVSFTCIVNNLGQYKA